jgi:hypothetical protein
MKNLYESYFNPFEIFIRPSGGTFGGGGKLTFSDPTASFYKKVPDHRLYFWLGRWLFKITFPLAVVIDKSVTGFVIERTRGVSNLTNIAKNYLFGFYGVFRILRKTILGVSNIAKNFLSGSVVNSRKLVV